MFLKLIVIGAGPSGMMAAISAKTHYPKFEVVLMDGNKRLGTKLRLTGGGRCNVTANVSNDLIIQNIPKNGKFLYSSLNNFGPQEIMNFFNSNDCPLKEEDHARVFPMSDKSHDIVSALEKKTEDLDVKILRESRVTSINFASKTISYNDKKLINYDRLIVATGGKTLAGSGSDGFMHGEVEKLGHTITELIPAEVPLVSNDQIIQEKTLQGLSFQDLELSIYQKGKLKKTIVHDLLFTHFGLSGPAALRASFYILKIMKKETPVSISIDFLKESSFEDLERELALLERSAFLKELPLPKRLLDTINSMSRNNQDLIDNLKKFPMKINTTRGFKHAFLTNGGVKLKEVDPKTLKSKIDPNVSFCGEILDVNAYTGGFNITAALSSGYTAGKFSLLE